VIAALDWSKVLVAGVTALSLAFGRFLWFQLRRQGQRVEVKDASVDRDRKLSEGWADYAAHMEARLLRMEKLRDKLQDELADCERREAVMQSHSEYLKAQLARRKDDDE
jgi:hypothetical protein